MSALAHPAILNDLAHSGDRGLPWRPDPEFQNTIEQCRRWGFKLQVEGNRVRLLFDEEQLVAPWIKNETPALAWESVQPVGFLRVMSTNTEAYHLAENGAAGGTLVFSEEQTAGRGRRNRVWHSPVGAGLYCTIVLRPQAPQRYWPILTHVTSVALIEAIRELAAQLNNSDLLKAEIKWPNDILVSGRKCAGILLESLADKKGRPVVLIGFGVNIHPGKLSEDVRTAAQCLDEVAHAFVPRRRFLLLCLKHFQILYLMMEQGRYGEILDSWKQRSSMWQDTRVCIGSGKERREAVTCGLDEMGALLIRNPDGSKETLMAEDVSVIMP